LPDEALVLRTNTGEDDRTQGTWQNFVMWRLLIEPIHFIMEERMLRGIKARAETPQCILGDIPLPA
jgi:hypothetical protein